MSERLKQRLLELATRQSNQELVQAALDGLIAPDAPKSNTENQSEGMKSRDLFIDNIKKLEADHTLRPNSVGAALGIFNTSDFVAFNKYFSGFRDEIKGFNGISPAELKNLFGQYRINIENKIISDNYFKEGLSEDDIFKLQQVNPQIQSLLATMKSRSNDILQDIEADYKFPAEDLPVVQNLLYPLQEEIIRQTLNPTPRRSAKQIGDEFIEKNGIARIKDYDKNAAISIGEIIKKGATLPVLSKYFSGNASPVDVEEGLLSLIFVGEEDGLLLDRLLSVPTPPPAKLKAGKKKEGGYKMVKKFSGKTPAVPVVPAVGTLGWNRPAYRPAERVETKENEGVAEGRVMPPLEEVVDVLGPEEDIPIDFISEMDSIKGIRLRSILPALENEFDEKLGENSPYRYLIESVGESAKDAELKLKTLVKDFKQDFKMGGLYERDPSAFWNKYALLYYLAPMLRNGDRVWERKNN
jgi:hypothetical protein